MIRPDQKDDGRWSYVWGGVVLGVMLTILAIYLYAIVFSYTSGAIRVAILIPLTYLTYINGKVLMGYVWDETGARRAARKAARDAMRPPG